MSKPVRKSAPRQDEPKKERRRGPAPGTTIESRENRLIRLAYDLAEERLLKKTATSQEVTTIMKFGSTLAQLEKIKLEQENKLLEAKTESLQSQKRVEELYNNAMQAFRTYSGQEEVLDDED